MNDQQPVEPTERIEFSEEDKVQLQEMGVTTGEVPEYHPLLEVWRDVLKPARDDQHSRITPQWANRICSSYSDIRFADMPAYRDRYFGHLLELMEVLDAEIATDPDCMSYSTPEEDAAENSRHYKQLLIDWQIKFLTWELEWECTDEDAEVELAAVSEVHKALFGNQQATGLVAFLDNIKFTYTEADQQELADALNVVRAEFEEGR